MPASHAVPVTLRHVPPTNGAHRAYTTVEPADIRNRFRIEKLTRRKVATRNGWRVTDTVTGAHQITWSLAEALTWLWRLCTPPEQTTDRFLILHLPPGSDPLYDRALILLDRVTGRWWRRPAHDTKVFEDIVTLAELQPA